MRIAMALPMVACVRRPLRVATFLSPALEQLYRLHAGRVYALCLRLAADPVVARELAQDTFVKAWEALPRFRADASLTTWLHRIAVNALLERRRGEKRRSARVSRSERCRREYDVRSCCTTWRDTRTRRSRR